ncbi:unnamed protein product [Linum trigynum]|uniref:Uncharacterized protein n=1 Tax=Linum trigynum TaxID=586398 RepID=A0AAV2CE46_9ROSI
MAKTLNAGSRSRTGIPVSSLLPPGTVDDPANATVATSAATTEHDSLVLESHSLPVFASCLWVFNKICFLSCCIEERSWVALTA